MAVRLRHPEVHPVRPSLVWSTLLTYGTNLAVAVLSLVNVLVVSRVLGPSGRGNVAFLTAIAYFVSNLSTIGVQEANANLGGSEPRLRRSLATNSVLFALFFGAAAAASLTGLIAVFPGVGGSSSSGLRWLTFSAFPVIILGIYLRFLVQADYGFRITNIAWLITPIANVTVNGLLAAVGLLSVGTAVATWIAGQATASVLLTVYVARRVAGFGRPSFALARRTLGFGVKSHAGRVMLLGNYRLDQWIVGAVSGARELGLYSVAVAWAEALWYLPTALSAVQRPDLVRDKPAGAARQAAKAFRVATSFTFVMAGAFVVAAPFLCTTIFGPAFRGSVDDLRLLVLGAFGVLALKLFGNALTAQQKPVLASVAVGFGFVATVVLDILLIPPFGGLGAALASALAYTAGGAVITVIFLRALGGRTRDLVPRIRETISVVRSSLRRLAAVSSRGPRHVPAGSTTAKVIERRSA